MYVKKACLFGRQLGKRVVREGDKVRNKRARGKGRDGDKCLSLSTKDEWGEVREGGRREMRNNGAGGRRREGEK